MLSGCMPPLAPRPTVSEWHAWTGNVRRVAMALFGTTDNTAARKWLSGLAVLSRTKRGVQVTVPLDALRALVAASPADAVLTVPRAWLAELIAPVSTDAAPAGSVDYTVAQVAQRFNRGASTIRTWCETDALPGAYRLNGREWRIPPAAIEAMQDRQREQHIAPRARTTARVADLGAWRKHSAGAR